MQIAYPHLSFMHIMWQNEGSLSMGGTDMQTQTYSSTWGRLEESFPQTNPGEICWAPTMCWVKHHGYKSEYDTFFALEEIVSNLCFIMWMGNLSYPQWRGVWSLTLHGGGRYQQNEGVGKWGVFEMREVSEA